MSKNVIAGQEDIFSMFGIVDEAAEQKKREEEERAKKAEELRKKVEAQREASSSQPAAKKVEIKVVFEPNESTVIRYYGESIDILNYFTTEELAEGLLVKKKDAESERKPLDGELLRRRMEKDFPELVKDMTEMVYIKDKNIVIPVMKAKKKGNCSETSSFEGVSLSIPFKVLQDFIAVAKLYNEHNLEVHADIYRNNDGEYILDIPKQQVNPLWCEVTEDAIDLAMRLTDAVKVMEIHSHHTMAALPSSQDNQSERVPGMIYGIVGRLNNYFPDLYLRVFVSPAIGHKRISYSDVFESPFLNVPEFDMEKVEVAI